MGRLEAGVQLGGYYNTVEKRWWGPGWPAGNEEGDEEMGVRVPLGGSRTVQAFLFGQMVDSTAVRSNN